MFRVESILEELAEIGQYLQEGKAPEHYSEKKKKILTIKATPFTLINGTLYKLVLDNVLHRCGLKHEIHDTIQEAHLGAAWRLLLSRHNH